MKGSTLHRSGLTREKMGVLASLSQTDKKHTPRAQLNQYYKTQNGSSVFFRTAVYVFVITLF